MSEFVDIKPGKRLEKSSTSPSHVYFLESGMASLIYKNSGGYSVEVAVIGNRGCTGCHSILGVRQCQHETVMQIAGSARRIRTSDFEWALARSTDLRSLLLSFVHAQIVERDEAALSASKATLAQRLARWLLRASDCVCLNDIVVTHDVISAMLGTRRAGVSCALAHLKDLGIIDMGRAHIRLKDRQRLLKAAGPYYGALNGEFDRVSIPVGDGVPTEHS